LLAEDERPPNGHHKIFISALDNNSALSLTIPLFDHMSYFGTPDAIGIVDHMKKLIFFSQQRHLVHLVREPRGKATCS